MSDNSNKSKKQTLKKVWDWIKITSLLVGLICGSVFVYQWWDRQQKLERLQTRLNELQELKDQVQRQYQLQAINFTSTNDLVNSPEIQAFFSDLLKNYAEKLAKSKELDTSQLPLKFEGLYYDKNIGNGYGEMGRCFPRQIIYPYKEKEINIGLNRLYLLNKFGVDKYFANNPEKSDDYSYLDISFDKMIDTCSHELAHYIQLVKWGRSSCESDLILKNGNYDERLEKEHKEFSKEIYGMIKNSAEYSEWEKKWKKI